MKASVEQANRDVAPLRTQAFSGPDRAIRGPQRTSSVQRERIPCFLAKDEENRLFLAKNSSVPSLTAFAAQAFDFSALFRTNKRQIASRARHSLLFL
jgi:hypothetical protein